MATPPGNTPNPLNYEELKKGIKALIDSEGDYNNLLKEANKQLESMDKHYVKIAARLDSMNKSTINVKEVQRELTKLNEKNYIAKEKAKRLEKALSDESKDLLKEQEKLGRLYEKATNDNQKKILQKKIEDNQSKISSNIELQSLEYAKAAAKITEKEVQEGENALKTERQVSRQLGISGNLMKTFAEKIGLGNEAYEAMSFKSRQIVEKQKEMSVGGRIISKIFGGWQVALAGAESILQSAFSAITDPVAIIGGIGLFAKLLKSAFDYIVGIQDKTVKFARAMNMSTSEARQLKMQYADINIANGDLFVNTQKLVDAQMDMVEALGVTNQISTQNLATNIKLKDIAGLEAETIASITESSIINGKSNESIVKSVFAQVKGLKQATGIQFENKKILKEASSLGGVLGLQFAKYPAQLTKSLLTVKAMGLELKQVDAMADSFLDFESSISKEFEAQLLTGKDINLAKARELFLNNDLAGAAAEINRQVGSTADFMKMNRIQQEALAGAMGMTRDQMGDMLKKQEMLSRLGAKDTDNAREQLRLGLAKYKNQKALSEAIGEENYQNLVNASLQEKIAAFIEKIKQSIADFVEKSGIIDKIEGMMNWLSKPENIRSVLMTVRDVFATIVDVVASVASGIIGALDFFGLVSDQKADELKGFLDGAGDRVRSMGGNLTMSAAKDKAGSGGGASSTSEGGSSKSTGLGVSTPNVIVKMREKEVFEIVYTGYNEVPSSDQQISTKYSTNPMQN
jgi:hypothetical protein